MVDPFAPNASVECSAPPADTLWNDTLDTPQGGLISTGFSNAVPSFEDVKNGTASQGGLAQTTPLVVWALMFGAQAGDIVSISFDGPDGPLFETDDVLNRTQALVFRAGGLNAPDGGWPSGTYTGDVTHSRDGEILDAQTSTTLLP